MLGLNEDGDVTALVIAEDADTTIFTVRPEIHDAPLLNAIRAHKEVHDPEDFREALETLEDALIESRGNITRGIRGQLHWLNERFLHPVR